MYKFRLTVWEVSLVMACLTIIISFLVAPHIRVNKLEVYAMLTAIAIFIPFVILMEKGRIIL